MKGDAFLLCVTTAIVAHWLAEEEKEGKFFPESDTSSKTEKN